MVYSNQTSRPTAVLAVPTTAKIYNVACPLVDTEYSQLLNADTKKFLIRVRGKAQMRVAFDTGETDVNWITVPPGCSYTDDGILFSGMLYFQIAKPGEVVEIIEWT